MPELLAALDEGWLWLGGSFLAAVLWANLARPFRRPRPGPVGEFVARLTSWRFAPWLLQLLRLSYYIGLPFAALVWGRALVELHLGLSSGQSDRWLDWAQDLGWTAALGVAAWALLAAGWWAYRRALLAAGEASAADGAGASGWVLLREAVYHEVHWAFYRNAPIVAVLERTGDRYWGVWIGLALVALEATLNPAWREGLGDPERAPAQLMRAALAVVSSALLLSRANLWLAVALHWGVSWGLAAWVRLFPLLPAGKSDRATT